MVLTSRPAGAGRISGRARIINPWGTGPYYKAYGLVTDATIVMTFSQIQQGISGGTIRYKEGHLKPQCLLKSMAVMCYPAAEQSCRANWLGVEVLVT